MKTSPILFSGPMVRALLDGTKTQTRRVMKPQPTLEPDKTWDWNPEPRGISYFWMPDEGPGARIIERCPYGVPGDLLWVRETWGVRGWMSDPAPLAGEHLEGLRLTLNYRADDHMSWTRYPDDPEYARIRSLVKCYNDETRWRPSTNMPRWASRLTLRITDVRVQRVRDISDDDVEKEGLAWYSLGGHPRWPRNGRFAENWVTMHGRQSWCNNEWVWALSFDVVRGNVEDIDHD